MLRHSDILVKKARKMARDASNLSYREIGKLLNVDNSLVSMWCRDLPYNKSTGLIKNNEKKRKLIKNSENSIFKKIKFNNQLCKLLCGIICGCEGAKYPSSCSIGFTNSDPALIKAFLCLFRQSFNLDESKFRVHLQIHDNQNFESLVHFWNTVTKISSEKFYKPTVTKALGNKHRYKYYGTCTIKYFDYKLQLKLIGIFEGFMRKFALLESGPDGKATSC